MPRNVGKACVLLVAGALVFGAACGKKPPVVIPPPPPAAPPPVVIQPQPPPPPPPAPPMPAPTPPPAPPTEDEIFASLTVEQLNEKRPLQDVFFELDQAELSEAARANLQKNSEWMRRWSSTRITIEGHADSRGTNEYNLALGERRAAAARDYLVSLGLPVVRISIVSKGEEQPFCSEETEACFTQNRRGHFLIVGK